MTMLHFPNRRSAGLLGVSCALSVLAAAAPASSEEAVELFTVVGHSEGLQERSLSAAVSYRDLDLTTSAGRRELHSRLWRTAAELCRRLGDKSGADPPFACEDAALEGAFRFEQTVIARAATPTYAAASPTQAGGR
jgi:UrcA family protein